MADVLLRVTKDGIVTRENNQEVVRDEVYEGDEGLTYTVSTANIELGIYDQLHVVVSRHGEPLYWRLLQMSDTWDSWYLLLNSGAIRLQQGSNGHVRAAQLVEEAVAEQCALQEWPVEMTVYVCQDMDKIFLPSNNVHRLVSDGRPVSSTRPGKSIYPEATYVMNPFWQSGCLVALVVYIGPDCDDNKLHAAIASLR